MAVGSAERKETRNLSIKVGLIVVAFLVAGYLGFFRGRGVPGQIDTPESAEPYYCEKCQKGFELTPAGFQRLSDEGGIRSASEGGRSGGLVFRCPHCGEFGGAAAYRCPNDGTIFPKWAADGTPSRCPKCQWAP